MKKFMQLFVILAMAALSLQSAVYASAGKQQITVTKGAAAITVNEEPLYFNYNQIPFTYKGTTYLPIRKIAEALGKQVTLNSQKSTINLSGNVEYEPDYSGYSDSYGYSEKISIQFVKLNIVYDGKLVLKEIQAIVYDNTTYLPMRALAEAVGATLELDRYTININKPVLIPHVQYQTIKVDGSIRSTVGQGADFLASYDYLAPSVVTFVNPDGTLNVGWDDQNSETLKIATLSADLKVTNTFSIKKEMTLMGSYTKDEQGNFYVLWGREVQENEKNAASVKISKYSNAGVKMGDVSFTAGTQYFNGTKEPFAFANAKLQYSNGLLVAFFGRLMFQSNDGLNHQSSTALYVDSTTMKQMTLPIPYSSHSFDQDVAFDGDNLVFADRGDVYDRGFVISKVDRAQDALHSVTPFYFKYGTAIYQQTFSELGGIAVVDDGYVLAGSSEKTMSAEMAKSEHNESRNIFIQRIARNFEQAAQPVLTKGDNQHFNISLRGSTYDVSNTGVVWLTDYRDKDLENAAHPKMTKIDGNRIVIVWEKVGQRNKDSSNMDYRTTYYMVVTPDGEIVKPATEIKGARINAGDSIRYHDGAVYWATANTNSKIIVYKLTDLK
ncbi:stalk domain-containing protein [Paenibacillus sp. 2TAB19]|uniref:stalk domain-containing protein n=1 Tax=Paenibacillus sp. 2TAB19 TaxID=3233003 RepID=UPI003F9C6AB5